MNGDLKKLYPKTIKTHNETPFHFEKKAGAMHILKAYNPICGDRFELYFTPKDQMIRELHFHGFGCAISKASTSVLMKTLEGKSFQEALATCNSFLRFIDQEPGETELSLSDDFRAFSGVRDFPERYDCATLSWKEMKRFLESKLR